MCYVYNQWYDTSCATLYLVYIFAQVVITVPTHLPLCYILLNQELIYELRCMKERERLRQLEFHTCNFLLCFTTFEEILLYISIDAQCCCSILLQNCR